MTRAATAARGALPFATLVVAWALLTRAGVVPALFLPPPGDVARTAWEMLGDGSLWINIGASLGRVLIGVAVSLPLAVGLGVAVGLSRRLAHVVEPIVGFFNALSGIAWLPLAITWFGLGWTSVTFIMFNTIFFLVFFNTLVGVRTVPKIFENAVLTLGGSRRHVIFHVLIPGALPSIVTGVRMSIGFGWRAVIAAEMIATSTGLGFLIYNAANFHQTDAILVGILTIGVLWLATDRLVLQPLERRTIERWGLVSTTP
ncbi:MAG TPA: ABC transporter permease [Methylomirabilota bacterium]|jgi:NitT/TauT family transport system permease protein/taurine transport system permease protein|nr:ABC transporter permease [Methylomirabilota bacterium]